MAINGAYGTLDCMDTYAQNCFREAGAGGSNPLAPTIQNIDIDALIPHSPESAGQCSLALLSRVRTLIWGAA